ncbi:MAG TPA: hypothetical protein VGM39_06370 [Kofleriaceae bacterium]|jgi:hypothetical protein
MSALRVVFHRPRFFISDVALGLWLDGQPIFQDGFLSGVDVSLPAAPGSHRLDAMIDLGVVRRRRSWDVDVPAPGCEVTIRYSRFWGNFAKKLDLRVV